MIAVTSLYVLIFNLTYPVLWYSSLKLFQLLYWLVGREFPRNYTDKWATWWGLGMLLPAFWFNRTRLRITKDPRAEAHEGPFIVIMNHQSTFDIAAVFYMLWKYDRSIRWVLKKELLHAPVVGAACRETRCAFIDRKDRDKAKQELEEFARQLERDQVSAVIFVEGTRATEKKLATSEFEHLLNPKPRGLSILCEALPHWPVLSLSLDWLGAKGTTIFGTGIWKATLRMETRMFTPEEVGDDVARWLCEEEWPRCDALIESWRQEEASKARVGQEEVNKHAA